MIVSGVKGTCTRRDLGLFKVPARFLGINEEKKGKRRREEKDRGG